MSIINLMTENQDLPKWLSSTYRIAVKKDQEAHTCRTMLGHLFQKVGMTTAKLLCSTWDVIIWSLTGDLSEETMD